MTKVVITAEESSLPSAKSKSRIKSTSRSPLSMLGRSFSKKGMDNRLGDTLGEGFGGGVGRGCVRTGVGFACLAGGSDLYIGLR